MLTQPDADFGMSFVELSSALAFIGRLCVGGEAVVAFRESAEARVRHLSLQELPGLAEPSRGDCRVLDTH